VYYFDAVFADFRSIILRGIFQTLRNPFQFLGVWGTTHTSVGGSSSAEVNSEPTTHFLLYSPLTLCN
jgi:hypothetical protein